jgi:O-antigen ligase
MTFSDASQSAPISRSKGADWLSWTYWVATIGFLFVTLVGLHPMATLSLEDRANGSPMDRNVVLGLLGLSIPVLWHNRLAVIQCVRGNKLLLGAVTFCLLSAMWSNFPDITIRRAISLATIVAISMAIVVGAKNIRHLHTLLFFSFVGTIILNFAATIYWPESTLSDEGLKGIYASKNNAGQIGTIAVVLGITWLRGTSNRIAILAGLIGIAICSAFLFLTDSKTSIAVTVVASAICILLITADWLGERLVLLLWAFLLSVVLALIGLLFWNNFDPMSTLSWFISDTSFTGRNSIWTFAYHAANERFWLGHGYGAYWDVGLENDPLANLEPGTWLGDVEPGIINEAHNGYLDLWLNIGLPSTIVVVAACIMGMARDFLDYIDISSDKVAKSISLASGLMMLSILLGNFTESTLFIRGAPIFFVVLTLRFMVSIRPGPQGRPRA